MKRDAILVVDGQEILNYGRQSIPTYVPGHRLNSGAFGCMGVGLPFGIGAKVAKPDTQVVVLPRRRLVRHQRDGDRHGGAPQDPRRSCVISNNGGWTADPEAGQARPQSRLHHATTRWRMDFGAHGEFVEKPHEIRPALERACGVRQAGGRQRDHRLQGSRDDDSLLGLLDLMGWGPETGPQAPALGGGPAEPGAASMGLSAMGASAYRDGGLDRPRALHGSEPGGRHGQGARRDRACWTSLSTRRDRAAPRCSAGSARTSSRSSRRGRAGSTHGVGEHPTSTPGSS